jgi:DNA-binding response OmpR family regulator
MSCVASLASATRLILIVEDDESTLDTYARILRLEGFETENASSAESALRTLHSRKPDAVIVDMRLPMADGLDFVRTLRGRLQYTDAPIAVVTGDLALSDAIIGELHHLRVCVRYKPLWVDELVALANALAARPSNPEPGLPIPHGLTRG